ncbi:MAG: hypothetical protein ACK5LX_07095 [Oscillospiraceae bacterium]
MAKDIIPRDESGIPQENIYKALEKATPGGLIGKLLGGIKLEKAAQTTKLNLSDAAGLHDLEFLRFYPNLDTLILLNSDVADLSGLAHVPNLTRLNLATNFTGGLDLSPLSSCPELIELELLVGRPYADREKPGTELLVRGLTNLRLPAIQYLYLPGLGIKDIGFTRGMTQLCNLELACNPLENLAPLRGHSALREVDFSVCGLVDISALAELPGLSWVELSGNPITDYSPLLKTPGLEYISGGAELDAKQKEYWTEMFSHIEEADFDI